MLCKDCARYDAEADRCLDDKLNPADWGGAITVANVMGVRAICSFNDFRERLVRSRIDALSRVPGAPRATRPTRRQPQREPWVLPE
ncbi:MAG: hypothetical protein HZC36_09355 [Armatimonadetes bacterium]|nr:hypothetical protein [Armatimonadota bacterium]